MNKVLNTMKDLTGLFLATLILLLIASNARANTVCMPAEYYNASIGMIVKSEVCYLDSEDEHNVTMSIEKIIEIREPREGETGFKG